MDFNPKAVRKKVREIVAEYKRLNLGRRTCVDIGGRHWSIEYAVMYWHEESDTWGAADWDDWGSSHSERIMMEDLRRAIAEKTSQVGRATIYPVCVSIRLICEHRTNMEKRLNIDGKLFANL